MLQTVSIFEKTGYCSCCSQFALLSNPAGISYFALVPFLPTVYVPDSCSRFHSWNSPQGERFGVWHCDGHWRLCQRPLFPAQPESPPWLLIWWVWGWSLTFSSTSTDQWDHIENTVFCISGFQYTLVFISLYRRNCICFQLVYCLCSVLSISLQTHQYLWMSELITNKV